ncbi:MAG: hypothetical protein Q9164_001527, partial [Protoblastenia rupestris]
AQRDPEEEGDYMAFEQLMADAQLKKDKKKDAKKDAPTPQKGDAAASTTTTPPHEKLHHHHHHS